MTVFQVLQELVLKFKNSTNKDLEQIQADFKIPPSQITKNNSLKEQYYHIYSNLTPESHEIKTWNFLFHNVPNPIVIGLDRHIYTEEGNELSYVDDSSTSLVRGKSISDVTPLQKVIKLSRQEILKFKNTLIELNDNLKDKLMLSSFDDTLTSENIAQLLKTPMISLDEVIKLEEKVQNYFAENITSKEAKSKARIKKEQLKIQKYFSNLKKVITQSKKKNEGLQLTYLINLNQFRKIKELIKEFNEFEKKSEELFSTINIYLKTINNFLHDSSKELYFKKETSELKFRILDSNNKIIESDRDIDTLSSGEKQILILFSYIKFNKNLNKLFIIDEPELSLHPKWQESFLSGIKDIMPLGTQLIFATHSPSIVGNHQNYCKILLPYNDNKRK